MDKILPCPWCGKEVKCRQGPSYSDNHTPGFRVACCGAGPEKPTAEEAIESWNRMSNGLKNNSVGLKISDPVDGGPYELNPIDHVFNYDLPENNKKYELPKTNIRYIVYSYGKYVCMPEDEWNKVRDKLLVWQALLIAADKNDEEVDNG